MYATPTHMYNNNIINITMIFIAPNFTRKYDTFPLRKIS